jgi:hypothetical protein
LDPQSAKGCILGIGLALLCAFVWVVISSLASQMEVRRERDEAREVLRKMPPDFKCTINLSFLGGELVGYAKSNKGRLPEDDGTGNGWTRAVSERVGNPAVVPAFSKCPSDHGPSVVSYVLNPNLAGKSILDFTDHQKAAIILLREIDGDGHRLAYYLDGRVKAAKGGTDEWATPVAADSKNERHVGKTEQP